MIKLKCKCGEQFRISEENMTKKDNVKCPNCEADLPSEIIEPLKAYAEYYVNAKEAFKRASDAAESTLNEVLDKPQDWIITTEE